VTTVTYEGKEYRLVGQEQGECLIKCGTKVLLWYKNGTRVLQYMGLNSWGMPELKGVLIPIVSLPKRYATLVAAEKRLPPSVERAFARGTMAFAVEVE